MLPVLLGLGILLGTGPANASVERTFDAGLPGIDICDPTPPLADSPSTGVIGTLGEPPHRITPRGDETTIWSSGGFAGMTSTPYDLGCAGNPGSYLRMAKANADAATTNTLSTFAFAVTSLADSIDRRAWNPVWLKEFLGNFSSDVAAIITNKILFVLLAVGMAASSLLMLIKFRDGNMVGAAQGVAWVLVVLALGAFLLVGPSLAATSAQSAGSGLVAAMNGGRDASDAATDRATEAIHYQAWLRRTFGSEQTEVGTKYGMALLDSQRITWAEREQVYGDPKALQSLREYKAGQFEEIAKKVKAEDPGAYQWLTREKEGSGISLVEACFALAAGFFRIAVDLLMLIAIVGLVFLACFFLALLPFLVTPAGYVLGIGMLNTAARAVGYVGIAAIGSFLFGIYLQAALQPGQSAWWSILLLVVGTIIAWTMIRPDRKALSLMTMGRVNGSGKLMKLLTGLTLSYVGGRVAGKRAAREFTEREFDLTPEPSENVAAPAPQFVYVRATESAPPGTLGLGAYREEEVLDGEVIYDSREASTLPTGTIRDVAPDARPMPTPPPAGSVGEVEIYQRPAPSEPESSHE